MDTLAVMNRIFWIGRLSSLRRLFAMISSLPKSVTTQSETGSQKAAKDRPRARIGLRTESEDATEDNSPGVNADI